jgi:hypothetical protein
MGKVLTGPAFLALAALAFFVGYVMFRTPELTWGSFIDSSETAVSLVGEQVSRLGDEPVACIGAGMMVAAIGVALIGLWRMRWVLLLGGAAAGAVVLLGIPLIGG